MWCVNTGERSGVEHTDPVPHGLSDSPASCGYTWNWQTGPGKNAAAAPGQGRAGGNAAPCWSALPGGLRHPTTSQMALGVHLLGVEHPVQSNSPAWSRVSRVLQTRGLSGLIAKRPLQRPPAESVSYMATLHGCPGQSAVWFYINA